VADGTVADGTVADGAVADGTVADGTVADGTVADGTVADEAVADGAVADGAVAVLAAAVRTWLRYIVPLTGLSAIALAPVIAIALRARPPVHQADAIAMLFQGWKLAAAAWPCQLVLIGGASAITGARRSQLGAFTGGVAQLARAIVPCVVAMVAIAIAGLALVIPGLVLLAMLSLTGASRERGIPAPLLDSIAVVRKHLRFVVLVVVAMIALDAAIAGVAQLQLVAIPVPKQPTAAQLAALRSFLRAIALVLVIASPLPATVLATIHARAHRP
jgi:hypothetical protein